jgi:tetratricopeptide (TPR) repeat protein
MAIGATLANLGMSRCYQGRYRDGVAPLERALQTSRAIGDRRTEATALGNLGMVYSHAGQKRRALECYESARKIREESGDLSGESLLISNCGSIQQAMGKVHAARDAFRHARELARQVEASREVALCTINLGSVHLDLGDLEESGRLYADAILRSIDLGERRFEGFARMGQALVWLRTGEPERALASLAEAERIAEELGSTELAQRVTYNRALVLLHADRGTEATDVIEAARARDPDPPAYDLELIRAIALLELGLESEAGAAFEAVLRAVDSILEDEPDLFQPRLDRALALAALIGSCAETGTSRSERTAQCRAAYADALSRCAGAGLIDQALALLRRVAAADGRELLLAEIVPLFEEARSTAPNS